MNYDETTRELTSDSGFIKRISGDYGVYTSPIYLGIYDSPENYAIATDLECEAYSYEERDEAIVLAENEEI